MVRKYQKQNVYEALMDRFKLLFEEFDNIYVSFSGGKDSGLLLNLVLDYRNKYYPDKSIGVFHQDFEAQYTVTTEYIERTFEKIKDQVEPYWVCLPMATRTALSSYEMFWYPWDNRKQELWVREMPKHKYVINLENNPIRTYRYKMHQEDLNLYRVIDPEIWTKLVGRVRGANFASIYGRTKAMGYRNVSLPEGHTWKSYTMFLLDTLPVRLRNNYVKKFNTSIQFWHETGGGLDEEVIQELEDHGYQIKRNGVSNYTKKKKSRVVFIGKIPDNTDDIKSSKDIPSWKRMCYCILKNDHTCRFMGFGLTRQQQKRVDVIREKYKSLEEIEYGV